ncbi:hypothetical protein ACQ4PT_021059 [Festuca glaucescens]
MEVAISAVTGELVSRFISFVMNKYHSFVMHRSALQDSANFDEVSSNNSSSSLYLAIPSKRSRKITDEDEEKAMHLEPRGALESLEKAVANMAEFVVLLGGCERVSRRPYDVYLYTENFMFGRHSEKQRLLSFLLQHNDPPGDYAPAVLPIVGGPAVGKKTLVAHVCADKRVRSRFSSVLHLNGDNLMRTGQGRTMFGMMLVVIEFASDVGDDEWKKFHSFVTRMGSLMRTGQGRTMFGMMLVVIEFASDVGDDEWKKFHSFVTRMGRGSKIIIISRLQRLA